MKEYDNYILQRFKSKMNNNDETDLAYKCRLYWFKNNFPSYKEVAWNLKESFLKSGGYQEAADEIFTFIGQ